MSRKSGWCSAPEGAKPKCRGCRWDLCACPCHEKKRKVKKVKPKKGLL